MGNAVLAAGGISARPRRRMTWAEGRLLPFFLVPAVRCVVERKVRGPLPIEPVVRGNALAVLLFFGGLFSVFQFWPGGWNAFEAAEVPAGALVGEASFLSEQAEGAAGWIPLHWSARVELALRRGAERAELL